MFSAYNLEFQRISLKYIDYLNAKVCASEFVDYEKRCMKPDASGMVEIKYRMKRKMVPVEEVELIDLYRWRLFMRKSYKNAGKIEKSNQQLLFIDTRVQRLYV